MEYGPSVHDGTPELPGRHRRLSSVAGWGLRYVGHWLPDHHGEVFSGHSLWDAVTVAVTQCDAYAYSVADTFPIADAECVAESIGVTVAVAELQSFGVVGRAAADTRTLCDPGGVRHGQHALHRWRPERRRRSDLYSQVSRYNPTTNTWSNVAPLPVALSQAAPAAANGKIYVAGGCTGGASVTNALRIYDIATNTWTSGANMPTSPGVEAAAAAWSTASSTSWAATTSPMA